MRTVFEDELLAAQSLVARMLADNSLLLTVQEATEVCIQALKAGNKLLFGGNGGSAADAQHLAGELVSRFAFDRPGLPGIALTTDSSILTAIANDYGYERLFSRQIQALGKAGDIFVAISTSGNSENLVQGAIQARKQNIRVIGLTGLTGGRLREHCDLCIQVPSEKTPHIQQAHIIIGHSICLLAERALFRPQ
jgi:D-sedoheptulose 7-phosphate isomerase